MARPSTGTTWKAGGFNDVDSRFLERGGLIAALIRDARGTDTDISPHEPNGAVKWSPFATDGQLREDLFAFVRDGGQWKLNSSPNEGFHLAGAFREGEGPRKSADIDSDDYMIEQDNFPFDTDVIKEDEPFSFTAVETAKPLIRRLRYNLPLSDAQGNVLVEAPGGVDAGWGKPVGADPVDRQVLLLRARRKQGRTIYTCDGYSLAKLTDIGDSQMGKRDADAAELTYKPLPDGIFMAYQDGEYIPVIKYTWVGGDGWTALGDGNTDTYILDLGGATGGSFTLTFRGQTTTAISASVSTPTASNVKSALVALDDGFLAGDWEVSGSGGGPFTVTTPGGPITGNGASLTGGTGLVISPA